jgi:hypothetical protein
MNLLSLPFITSISIIGILGSVVEPGILGPLESGHWPRPLGYNGTLASNKDL